MVKNWLDTFALNFRYPLPCRGFPKSYFIFSKHALLWSPAVIALRGPNGPQQVLNG